MLRTCINLVISGQVFKILSVITCFKMYHAEISIENILRDVNNLT